MQVQTYLHFDGNCAEALEFYKKALGAKVDVMMRFSDAPVPNDPNMVKPGMENQVMHSSFRIGDTTLMASDCGKAAAGFSLTIGVTSTSEVERLIKAISEGGQVIQAPQETFFAHSFGVCNDKFGVNWIVLNSKQMEMERSA